MREKINIFTSVCINVLSSNRFLYFVILLFILQALWIAFSFRYPMVYDESYHFPVIKLLSHYWLPFVSNQPTEYDQFGSFESGGSLLFHYIMSFPYRVFAYFIHDQMWQVIFLRILNVFIVALGLYIFARLLEYVKIKRIYTNIGLLLFILIPIVPFIAAHISYDNLLFTATALYMFLAVKVLGDKKIDWRNISMLLSVGCFAALVKFTFLPLFAASVFYLLIASISRYRNNFLRGLWKSIKTGTIRQYVIFGIPFLLLVGLFSYAYIKPAVQYGTPDPSCPKVLGEKRCSVGRQGFLEKRAKGFMATKDQVPVDSVAKFSINWLSAMYGALTSSGSNIIDMVKLESSKGLSSISTILFFSILIGIGVLLYSWRTIAKNRYWYFLIAMIGAMVLSVYLFNMNSYYKSYHYSAIQVRYLLSMAPVIIVMIVAACAHVLHARRNVKMAVFLIVMALFTQGGGAVTHILVSKDEWYWPRPRVIEANHIAKKMLQPLVKEYFVKPR